MPVWDGPSDALRVLQRMARQSAALAPDHGGEFLLLAAGDRRRRPLARVRAALVASLRADGAVEPAKGERFIISAAGRARLARREAAPDEAFRAQHGAIVERAWMDEQGRMRRARGADIGEPLARILKLKDANGAQLLSASEIAAARALRSDWEAGQEGLVRTSDWSAPPRGNTPRGGSPDAAAGAALDARRRFAEALETLPPMLSTTVQAVCLQEQTLSDLERRNAWPGRSGKLALKLALSELAAFYAGRSRAGGRFEHGLGVAADTLDHGE